MDSKTETVSDNMKLFLQSLPKQRYKDFRLWCLRNNKIDRGMHVKSYNHEYLHKLWQEYVTTSGNNLRHQLSSPQVMSNEKEMNSELLPCPFCSSPAEWINEALADSHYYIRCPHCHIVMKEDRRDKVIGMWNTRAELAKQKELKDELAYQLNMILDEYDRNKLLIKIARFDRLKSLIKKSNSQQ